MEKHHHHETEAPAGDARHLLDGEADRTEPSVVEIAEARDAAFRVFDELAGQLTDQELQVMQLLYYGERERDADEVARILGLDSARPVTDAERSIRGKLEGILAADEDFPQAA